MINHQRMTNCPRSLPHECQRGLWRGEPARTLLGDLDVIFERDHAVALDERADLQHVALTGLDDFVRLLAVSLPAGIETAAAIVRDVAELVAEAEVPLLAAFREELARRFVHLPAGNAGPHGVEARHDRALHGVEVAPDGQ